MKPSLNIQPSLISLPTDVTVNVIGPFLNAGDILNLAKTSKQHFYSLFSERPLYVHARLALKNLLNHAALGEWEKAEKIWEMHPGLLTCRGTVYHPNYIYEEWGEAVASIPFYINPGRYKYVNLTTFQIALVNEEWEEAGRMTKYMTVEEQQKQLTEVFPDKKIIKFDWNLEEAKRLLHAVLTEIIKDPHINDLTPMSNDLTLMSESTRKALFALYAYTKPKAEHKAGLVFDANFYLEALNMYGKQFGKFKNNAQRSFWCIRVEEWLAGCLGTAYLRPHAQGPGFKLHRRGCILSDGSSYFSFHRPNSSIPGYHHFVGYYGSTCQQLSRGARCQFFPIFQQLISKTMSAGTAFMQQYSPPEKATCLIC